MNAIVYAWTREDFLLLMGIPSGINDDDITIDGVPNHYEEDIENSLESSYNSSRSRALEDSASMSIRNIPEVDCGLNVQRESNAADYHWENLPYCNTF